MGRLQLTACTISGNSGSAGAGIYNEMYPGLTAHATLIDTIVAGNTAPGGAASDIGGAGASFVTGGYNLIGTGGSGGITGGSNGNLITADPKLGALTNNGGLTQTMALQPGSPAIGAGTTVGAPSADQRGLPRPSDSIDIGAFQTQAVPDLPPIAQYQLAGTSEGVRPQRSGLGHRPRQQPPDLFRGHRPGARQLSRSTATARSPTPRPRASPGSTASPSWPPTASRIATSPRSRSWSPR